MLIQEVVEPASFCEVDRKLPFGASEEVDDPMLESYNTSQLTYSRREWPSDHRVLCREGEFQFLEEEAPD